MIKDGLNFTHKNGIYYQLNEQGKPVIYQSWKGNAVAFCYDWIMDKILLPGKLGATNQKHYAILRDILQNTHHERVIELAAGSGSVVNFLALDNSYTGTDISGALLIRAQKRLKNCYEESSFYLMGAEKLIFADNSFDVCLCILAINFFADITAVIKEIKRVLISGGRLVCCVPVPERNSKGTTINGRLYSEQDLKRLFQAQDGKFSAYPAENGAILYFIVNFS